MRTIFEQKVGCTGVALGWSSQIIGLTKVLGGVLFFAMLYNPIQVPAATGYVVPGGAGARSGADWNNAWDSGSIGWSSVAAGDTVWLAGGNYSSGISFTKSGSSGNPIYVKRATASDAAATSAAGWSSSFDSKVVISTATGLTWNSSSGSYMVVDGRTAGGILLSVPNTSSTAAACGVNNAHDIILTNLEIAGPGSGMTFNGDSYLFGSGGSANIVLASSSVHGSPNLIALGQNANGIIFDHDRFYDNGAANASAHHPNLCYAANVANLTFRYCDFTSWTVEGIYLLGNCGAVYVYGNTFHDASGVARCFSLDQYGNTSGSQGPVYVYNNTFVNVSGVGVYCQAGSPVPYASGSQAWNNIYWNCLLGNDTPGSFDYEFSSGSVPGSHSINNGSNPFSNLSGGSYMIVTNIGGSYPRENGIAITDINGQTFDVDPNGTSRTINGANWDIGAYSYGAATNNGPTILVTPGNMSYGTVLTGTSKTNSITVANMGIGMLSGTASASAPFSVVSGGSYSLGAGQTQLVMVAFSPPVASNYVQSVTFTGGGGTNAVVSGSTLPGVQLQVTPARRFVLTVIGVIGNTYNIQATQDFKIWTVIGTVKIGASGSSNFTDTNAASFSKRFYRIQG